MEYEWKGEWRDEWVDRRLDLMDYADEMSWLNERFEGMDNE